MSHDMPDEAACLGCGYLLRQLPARRCPECGRGFDPADPRTYRVPNVGTPRTRWVFCVLGAILGPPAVVSTEAVVWRWAGRPAYPDAFLPVLWILVLGAGAAFVACLPVRAWARIVLVLLYLPVAYHAVWIYALLFAGYVFGEWL